MPTQLLSLDAAHGLRGEREEGCIVGRIRRQKCMPRASPAAERETEREFPLNHALCLFPFSRVSVSRLRERLEGGREREAATLPLIPSPATSDRGSLSRSLCQFHLSLSPSLLSRFLVLISSSLLVSSLSSSRAVTLCQNPCLSSGEESREKSRVHHATLLPQRQTDRRERKIRFHFCIHSSTHHSHSHTHTPREMCPLAFL